MDAMFGPPLRALSGTRLHVRPEDIDYSIFANKAQHHEINPNTSRIDMSAVAYTPKTRADEIFWAKANQVYEQDAKYWPKAEADEFVTQCQEHHMAKSYQLLSGHLLHNRLNSSKSTVKDKFTFSHVVLLSMLYGADVVSRTKWYNRWAETYNREHPTPLNHVCKIGVLLQAFNRPTQGTFDLSGEDLRLPGTTSIRASYPMVKAEEPPSAVNCSIVRTVKDSHHRMFTTQLESRDCTSMLARRYGTNVHMSNTTPVQNIITNSNDEFEAALLGNDQDVEAEEDEDGNDNENEAGGVEAAQLCTTQQAIPHNARPQSLQVTSEEAQWLYERAANSEKRLMLENDELVRRVKANLAELVKARQQKARWQDLGGT